MRVLSSPRSLFFPARVAFGTVLLMVFAVAASAYTVVFRDGRRVDVPNSLTVTQTTFMYEVAPGINRTVQMVLVDVAATERANNETPGSFLRRAEQHIKARSTGCALAPVGR